MLLSISGSNVCETCMIDDCTSNKNAAKVCPEHCGVGGNTDECDVCLWYYSCDELCSDKCVNYMNGETQPQSDRVLAQMLLAYLQKSGKFGK